MKFLSLPGASPGLGERDRGDGLDGPELVRQPAVHGQPGGLVEQGQSLDAVPVSESRIWALAVDRRTFCMGVPVGPLLPAMVMSRWASARFPAPR